jgi:transposase InsO family protein
MKQKRPKPEEDIRLLRECDGSGMSQERFAQQKEISVATHHRWSRKYGQMDEADAERPGEGEPRAQEDVCGGDVGHQSFHDKFRREDLGREIFYTLSESRVVIADWRRKFSEVPPHRSLGMRTPKKFTAELPPRKRRAA